MYNRHKLLIPTLKELQWQKRTDGNTQKSYDFNPQALVAWIYPLFFLTSYVNNNLRVSTLYLGRNVKLLTTDCMNVDKGNNKITELRTIFQRESQNS